MQTSTRTLALAFLLNDVFLALVILFAFGALTPSPRFAAPAAPPAIAMPAAPRIAEAAPPAAPPALPRAAPAQQPSGDPAYGACPPATEDQAWERIRQEPWLPFLGQQVGISPPGIAHLKLCFDYSYGKRYEGQMTQARWRATWEHRANLFALSLGLDPIYLEDEPGADLFPRVKRTLAAYAVADALGIQY